MRHTTSGIILGHYQIIRWKWKKALSLPTRDNAAVLTTVVSSRMLRAIALSEGLIYCDTLTGFKWIGNKARELSHGSSKLEPLDVVFSYEEALGYCVGDILADKDGISAAIIMAELLHSIYSAQIPDVNNLLEYLHSIYKLYGYFASYNSYFFSHDNNITNEIFRRMRHQDPSKPDDIVYSTAYGGVNIKSVKDVTLGYDSSTSDHASDLPRTPDSHMIMFEFTNGCSITLRTSGTEPKIKYYTELPGKYGDDVESVLKQFVDKAVYEMLQPDINGLIRP